MFSGLKSVPHGATICLFLFFTTILVLDPLSASATDAVSNVMCTVLNIVQGKLGKGIAAFAIIFIGISLFMGKVSWGLAVSTALGIGAIFGAGSLVDTITGSGAKESCTGEAYKNIG